MGVDSQFARNRLLYGEKGLGRLQDTSVAILGIGGVGSYAAEALARSGIGKLILIDKDVVDVTNINRQLHALWSTIGMEKVKVMKERIADISPNCLVVSLQMFYTEDTYEKLFGHSFDYLIDASDTISYKVHVINQCRERNISFISVMGAANKNDPTAFKIVDISDTYCDPIARIIRNKLRKNGIYKGVPVVFSPEKPFTPVYQDLNRTHVDGETTVRKITRPPASNAMVPATAGLISSSWVVNNIINSCCSS